LVSITAPESLGAEKFRFLAVRLRQMQQAKNLKRLLITSTIAEEGKSLITANLAVTLARRRQRVILIEGDLRRPTLTDAFGLGRLEGICESLKNDADPMKNVYYLDEARLWFMPAGRPPENPLELMQSGRLPHFLDRLAVSFDWILIDSPPILPLADTTVWSRFVDGVLLVAREGKSEKAPLKRGLEALGRANILGVVVNSCSNVDNSNYYQRYGGSALKKHRAKNQEKSPEPLAQQEE
jgi:capsular exopolysaccharide synthesis family protein